MQRSRIVFLKFFCRVYRANILFYLWFFTFICFSLVNPLVSEVGHKIPWSRFKDLKLRQIKPEVTSTIRGGNSKTQQSAANLDFCFRFSDYLLCLRYSSIPVSGNSSKQQMKLNFLGRFQDTWSNNKKQFRLFIVFIRKRDSWVK